MPLLKACEGFENITVDTIKKIQILFHTVYFKEIEVECVCLFCDIHQDSLSVPVDL